MKAQTGHIPNCTGGDLPYEVPNAAEVVLDNAEISAEKCVDLSTGHIVENGYIDL